MAKKAVLYARVSTSHHEQNPQVQIDELRRYAEASGLTVVEEIIDHGYSGSNSNRPGLNRLMELVKARRVTHVLVLKLDRLFRSLRHLVATLDEFSDLKVAFVAVRDGIDYSSPSGRFFAQVLGSLAEFERELLRERTLMGLEHARRSGKRLGRPRLRDDTRIQGLRAIGWSYGQISKELGISRGSVYRALKAGSKTPSKCAPKSQVISRGGK